MYLENVRSLLNCCQNHEETVSTYSKQAARKQYLIQSSYMKLFKEI